MGSATLPTLHPDETRILREVATGAGDPRNPALLTHLTRWVAAATDAISPPAIAAAGRLVSAAFGALAVVACWRALRAALRSRAALFGSAIVAVSPQLVSDARVLAPDAASLALGTSAVLCLGRWIERRTLGWSLALGGVIGLAISAHYGGTLTVLLCLAAPLVVDTGNRRDYFRGLGPAFGVATIVFAGANFSLLLDPTGLLAGVSTELRRLFAGDHLHVSILSSAGIFHIRSSLAPGVTTATLIVALLGFVAAFRARTALAPTGRLVVLYGGLALLIAELSPLKPLPGAARYVLPTLPAIGLGCGLAVQAFEDASRRRLAGWIPTAAMVVLLAFPLWSSVRLSRALAQDPRTRSDAWLAANGGRTLRGPFSSAQPADVPSVAAIDLAAARRAGVTHVTTSSFVYETFSRGSRLAGQADYVYERHARYQALFEYPFEEFTPDVPSFGWSQPTIRVLDIREPRPPGRP